MLLWVFEGPLFFYVFFEEISCCQTRAEKYSITEPYIKQRESSRITLPKKYTLYLRSRASLHLKKIFCKNSWNKHRWRTQNNNAKDFTLLYCLPHYYQKVVPPGRGFFSKLTSMMHSCVTEILSSLQRRCACSCEYFFFIAYPSLRMLFFSALCLSLLVLCLAVFFCCCFHLLVLFRSSLYSSQFFFSGISFNQDRMQNWR